MKFTASSSMIPAGMITLRLDGLEVPQDGIPVEKDVNHTLTATLSEEAAEFLSCGATLELSFPHCSMEFQKVGAEWERGTHTDLAVSGDPQSGITQPDPVLIRITGNSSDDEKGAAEGPGAPANLQSSPPKFDYDAATSSPVLMPPGIGLEIPMGAAMTPEGYRSAGLLVNYGPVSAGFAETSNLRYNGIPEVGASVFQHPVVDGQGVTTEVHYVAPQGVLRVRGWNSSTQSYVGWQGAQETSVEAYDPVHYNAASYTFSGEPHSYYHMEIATGDSLQPGLRLVQSNHGVYSSCVIQASGDGLLLRETAGSKVIESVAVPPAQNSTSWQKLVTVNRESVVTFSTSEDFALQGTRYDLVSKTEDPSSASGDELTTFSSYYSNGQLRSISRPDGSWSYYIYEGNLTTTYSPWLSLSNLVNSNGVWTLPTTGLALKTTFSGASSGAGSGSSKIIDFSGTLPDVLLSSNFTTRTEESGFIRSTHGASGANGTVNSYTLAYSSQHTDRFLAGRTLMTWDDTGRATLHEYAKGDWNGSVFSVNVNGAYVQTCATTGYFELPFSNPTAEDFNPGDNKVVTITSAVGVVREETFIWANGDFQSALKKDFEYEPAGQFRLTGTKISGIYVAKTDYVSPLITRWAGPDFWTGSSESFAGGFSWLGMSLQS